MPLSKEELADLLDLEECGWLDFKREIHKVLNRKAKNFQWEKNELVRDVLALANGNTPAVDKTAYLIIGIEDQRQPDGIRPLHPVPTFELGKKQIMQWVNAFADPHLEELEAYFVPYGGQQLFVIEIPPSVHVHKIKRELQTGHAKVYPQNVVFMRAGEEIVSADARQVQALERAKKKYHAMRRSFNPVLGLGLSFALIFGLIDWGNLSGDSEPYQNLVIIYGEQTTSLIIRVVMAVFFGAVGAGLGYSYVTIHDIRAWFIKATKRQKILGIIVVIVVVLLWYFFIWPLTGN